jgi:hypothetical protein
MDKQRRLLAMMTAIKKFCLFAAQCGGTPH